MRTPGNSLPAGRVRRIAVLGVLALFAVLLLAGCSVDKTSGGDPAGLTTSSGHNLVGLAPGTITADDFSLRVSQDADGEDAVQQLLSFVRVLSDATAAAR